MVWGRYVHFLIFVALLSAPALADGDFFASFEPVKDSIYEDEIAVFELTLINTQDFEDSLQIYTHESDWIVSTDPLLFKVAPNSTNTFRVKLDPKTSVTPGQYGVSINVKSTVTNKLEKDLLLVYVKPLNPLPSSYRASIALNLDMPTEVDPRKPLQLDIYMRNRNALDIDNLTLLIESQLVSEERQIPLQPLEERNEKVSFNLNPLHEPIEDKMIVKLLLDSELVSQQVIPFRVIGYSELVEEKSQKTFFLKTTKTIKLTNNGNIDNIRIYKIPTSFWSSLFTNSEPDHEVLKEIDGRFLSWHLELEPQESIQLRVTENYRLIFYIITLIIISVVLYYIYRSPVIVKKEAILVDPTHEGASEMKIRLLVRNRSNNPVENTRIIELIPSIAKLTEHASPGTMEPSKVIHNEKKGTLVRWDINYLEPLEERIITYSIKSRLNIIGKFHFPRTKIKFETHRGKERVVYSKRFRVQLPH